MEDRTMMNNAARDVQPRILSVTEVAKILGRSDLATRRAINRGEIPSRKFGDRVVILADELDAFLRNLPVRTVRR
jgi:excisionase family DNA binding protein